MSARLGALAFWRPAPAYLLARLPACLPACLAGRLPLPHADFLRPRRTGFGRRRCHDLPVEK